MAWCQTGNKPNMQQAIIWTNDGLDYSCTKASLGLNELTHWPLEGVAVIVN